MKKLTIRAFLIAAAVAVVGGCSSRTGTGRGRERVDRRVLRRARSLWPLGRLPLWPMLGSARVPSGWQPYSNGQWVYTEYGWTWISDDPWGGNPYHYGTWAVPRLLWVVLGSRNRLGSGLGDVELQRTSTSAGRRCLRRWSFGGSGYPGGRRRQTSRSTSSSRPTDSSANVSSVRVSTQQNATISSRDAGDGFLGLGRVRPQHRHSHGDDPAGDGRVGSRRPASRPRARRRAPRATRSWSVVAPAREVKAAVAARPQSANARNAPAEHGNGNAKTSRAPEASKIESQRPQAEAPAATRPEPNKAAPARPAEGSTKQPAQKPKHPPAEEKPEKPEMQARHAAPPPAAHHSEPAQRPEPNGAEAAPKPKSHADADKPEAQANRAPADAPAGASSAAPSGRAGPEAQGKAPAPEGEAGREGPECPTARSPDAERPR